MGLSEWVKVLDSISQWWKLWIGSAVWCDNWRCFNVTVLSLHLAIEQKLFFFCHFLSMFSVPVFTGIGKSLMQTKAQVGCTKIVVFVWQCTLWWNLNWIKLELPSDFSVVTLGFLNSSWCSCDLPPSWDAGFKNVFPFLFFRCLKWSTQLEGARRTGFFPVVTEG